MDACFNYLQPIPRENQSQFNQSCRYGPIFGFANMIIDGYIYRNDIFQKIIRNRVLTRNWVRHGIY